MSRGYVVMIIVGIFLLCVGLVCASLTLPWFGIFMLELTLVICTLLCLFFGLMLISASSNKKLNPTRRKLLLPFGLLLIFVAPFLPAVVKHVNPLVPLCIGSTLSGVMLILYALNSRDC